MYPSSSEGLNKETDDAIFFFTPAFHPLDNYSAHSIELWGRVFATAEHAFLWKKFSHKSEIANQILTARSPEAAKQIALSNKEHVLDEWYDQRDIVMRQVIQAKADQHQDVREALERSGTRMIVENSPVDDYWGAGPSGTGQNVIGKIWMEIRKNQ